MITYRYDAQANVTMLTDGPTGPLLQAFAGRIPYKTIHDAFGVVVFEVIKEDPIVALPPVTD